MTNNQDDANIQGNPAPSNMSPKDVQDETLKTANKARQGEGLSQSILRDVSDDNINLPQGIQIIDTMRSSAEAFMLFDHMENFFANEADSFRSTYENLLKTNNPDKNLVNEWPSTEAQNKTNGQSSIYYVTPSATNNAPRIFVSHSQADNDFCSRLVQDLRTTFKDESAVWCNMQEGLRGGSVWWDKIVGELSTRDFFIVVLSPDAMNSRWVHYELNIALSRDMFIIPLLLQNCVVPTDLRNTQMISFHKLKTYLDAFNELLLALNLSVDELSYKVKSKLEVSKAALMRDITQMIEVAFAKDQWYVVLRKINYLVEQVPGFVTATIYRMQALSFSKIGYKLLALEALDVALALVSDESLYLTLLEDYATILVSLRRWIDLVRLVDEALQLAPNDARWLALQKQVYSQLGQPMNIEVSSTQSQARLEHLANRESHEFSSLKEAAMKIAKVDFAIITILPDEYAAIHARFTPEPYRDNSSQHTYGISQVQTKDGKNRTVAIARTSRQGNDVSQQLANWMISDLNPGILLVVGIGGGVPDTDFTLGDVIVSSHIHNFDVNAIKGNKTDYDVTGGIHPKISDITANLYLYESLLADWNSEASISMLRPHLSLTEKNLRSLIDKDVDEAWREKVEKALKWYFDKTQRGVRAPKFLTGTVASSNTLVRSNVVLAQWLQDVRSIRAVEMETAGVYQAAQHIRQQYPVMAIRGISDIIGFKRDDNWKLYACQTAAAFAYAFIKAGIVEP